MLNSLQKSRYIVAPNIIKNVRHHSTKPLNQKMYEDAIRNAVLHSNSIGCLCCKSINSGSNKTLVDNSIGNMAIFSFMDRNRKPCVCNKYLLAFAIVIFIISIIFLSVSVMKHKTQEDNKNICLKSQCVQTAAMLISAMAPTVDPCTDFYKFSCGKWSLRHRVPEGRDSINKILILSNKLDTNIEGMLKIPIKTSDNKAIIKAKVFYKNCQAQQNHSVIMHQLEELFRDLGGWPMIDQRWREDQKSWEQLVGKVKRIYGHNAIFSYSKVNNPNNASLEEIKLQLTGDVISKQDFHSILKYYRMQYEMLVNVASLFGANLSHAKRQATNILRFQMQFSRVVNESHQDHKLSSNVRRVNLTELEQDYPGIDWLKYFKEVDPKEFINSTAIEISDSIHINDFATALRSTKLSTLYNYVIWKLLEEFLPLLSKQFIDIVKKFGTDDESVNKIKERWRRCIEITNSKMGLAVAALFSKNHIFTEGKEQVTEIAENVRSSFHDVIRQSDWIDEESNQRIRKKIKSMKFTIGYPEVIGNDKELAEIYSTLNIKKNNLIQNLVQLRTFVPEAHLKKHSSVTNLSPITLNAYYHKERNEVIFPAAIMQPPFYNFWSPKSLNYGGIGVVIGHEIIHLFDVEVLEESSSEKVFTETSLSRFIERTKCVHSDYQRGSFDSVKNGHQQNLMKAKQEDIADMSGVKLAFKALKKWRRNNNLELLLPGISLGHDQLFFLNYAQLWCEVRNKKLSKLKKVNTHRPKHMRVIGPLSNSEDFAKAYSCSKESTMNPKNKCNVW